VSTPRRPKLILNPHRPDLPQDGFDPVPIHAMTVEDQVGEQLAKSPLMVMSLPMWDIDASQWAFLPDGRAFVACGLDGSRKDHWIERRLLVEDDYETTVGRIDSKAREIEQGDLASFWEGKRTEILGSHQVIVRQAMSGAAGPAAVTVEPGTYPIVELLEERLVRDQLCPFSLIIKVRARDVAIVPDVLFGVDDEAATEAEGKGLAAEVAASAVKAAFAAAPEPLGGYVPASDWLTDNQMHYLDEEWMGAACVLERMPASQQEVAEAAKEKPQVFTGCGTNPGVRFGEDIFILNSYRGTGVEYHESVHKLSHRALRDVLGQMLNEGVTEYFTWKVIGGLVGQGLIIRDESQYGRQREAVTILIKHGVTEAELAQAYFKGLLQPLFDKFRAMTKGKLGLDAYAARLDKKNADAAIEVLEATIGT
jgi:hypothetical protein